MTYKTAEAFTCISFRKRKDHIKVRKVILASKSPRRLELMKKITDDFEIIPAETEEKTDESDPAMIVMALSGSKAKEVFYKKQESNDSSGEGGFLVIGADTIVVHDNEILGKPRDEKDAFRMLKALSGDVHSVYTGVTVISEEGIGSIFSFYEETLVYIKSMNDDEINAYIATGEPMDKAGAYGIQTEFGKYVEKIDGDYDNVVGLPVERLAAELKKHGLDEVITAKRRPDVNDVSTEANKAKDKAADEAADKAEDKKIAKVWVAVATHKEYRMPADIMYVPVFVGAKLRSDEELKTLPASYKRDDTGDNISEQNPRFCELTALYWAWKNLDSKYLGLVHYRRHFRGRLKPEKGDAFSEVLRYRELKKYLGKYSVIVPCKRHYYIETLEQHYAHNHFINELHTARDIMLEKYPEYEAAYKTAMNRTWGYMFNMMILRRDLMDDYCDWLFDILFTLTERLGDSPARSSFEERYAGRVSERLFNVWLEKKISDGVIKPEEIKEIPFMYMEKINALDKGVTFLKAKFLGKKPKKSF